MMIRITTATAAYVVTSMPGVAVAVEVVLVVAAPAGATDVMRFSESIWL